MTERAAHTDEDWMRVAIGLAHQCTPAEGAYSVGVVIVDAAGQEIARGYSRETDPKVHAEEAALQKLGDDPRLRTATMYSTLEPCSQRASRPKPCAQLIIDAGIPRAVIAWREPSLFVDNCVGVETMEAAGVTVLELSQLAPQALAPNTHLNLDT